MFAIIFQTSTEAVNRVCSYHTSAASHILYPSPADACIVESLLSVWRNSVLLALPAGDGAHCSLIPAVSALWDVLGTGNSCAIIVTLNNMILAGRFEERLGSSHTIIIPSHHSIACQSSLALFYIIVQLTCLTL